MVASELSPRPEIREQDKQVLQDALRTRMVIGGVALNPDKVLLRPEEVPADATETITIPLTINSLRLDDLDHNKSIHRMISNTSVYERSEVKDTVTEWREKMINYVGRFKTSESQNPEQRQQTAFLKKLGYDPNTFTVQSAQDLYDTYFAPGQQSQSVHTFVGKVLNLYKKEDGTYDINKLKEEENIIKSISGIFGTESSKLIAERIQAFAAAKTDTEAFLARANKEYSSTSTVNFISKDKDKLENERSSQYKLLKFLWTHGRYEPELRYIAPPVIDTTPPLLPTSELEQLNKVKYEVDTPPESHSLIQWLVQHRYGRPNVYPEIDKTKPKIMEYYVEHVPHHLTLTPEQIRNLPVTNSYFYFTGEGDDIGSNRLVVPFASEFEGVLVQDRESIQKRFNDIAQQDDNDSGVIALAGIMNDSPEKQAQIYALMAKTALELQTRYPQLFSEWLERQFAPLSMESDESKKSISADLFQLYDVKNPDETWRVFSYNNDLTINKEKTVQKWQQEFIPDLKRKIDAGNVDPLTIHRMEVLFHTVKVADLAKIIQTQGVEQATLPPPQPEPVVQPAPTEAVPSTFTPPVSNPDHPADSQNVTAGMIDLSDDEIDEFNPQTAITESGNMMAGTDDSETRFTR